MKKYVRYVIICKAKDLKKKIEEMEKSMHKSSNDNA